MLHIVPTKTKSKYRVLLPLNIWCKYDSEATDTFYFQTVTLGSLCCLFNFDGLISVLYIHAPPFHSSTTWWRWPSSIRCFSAHDQRMSSWFPSTTWTQSETLWKTHPASWTRLRRRTSSSSRYACRWRKDAVVLLQLVLLLLRFFEFVLYLSLLLQKLHIAPCWHRVSNCLQHRHFLVVFFWLIGYRKTKSPEPLFNFYIVFHNWVYSHSELTKCWKQKCPLSACAGGGNTFMCHSMLANIPVKLYITLLLYITFI